MKAATAIGIVVATLGILMGGIMGGTSPPRSSTSRR